MQVKVVTNRLLNNEINFLLGRCGKARDLYGYLTSIPTDPSWFVEPSGILGN